MNEITNIDVISAIKRFVFSFKQESQRDEGKIIDIMQIYSKYISENYKSEGERIKEEIQKALIKPFDPLDADSNFIKFSDYDYNEPAWTKWFVSCFRDEHVGLYFWRALCGAIISSIENDSNNRYIMNKEDWVNISYKCPPQESFRAEYPIPHGRLDMRIHCYDYLIYIENKVGAPELEGQLFKYRKNALEEKRKHNKSINKIGLIYLTEEKRDDVVADYINVSYQVFAGNLRGQLNKACIDNIAADAIKLWPIYCALSSIEQGILELTIKALKEKRMNKQGFRMLQEVSSYLSEIGG